MRIGWRAGKMAGIAVLIVMVTPSLAQALTVSVPSAVNLGSVSAGSVSVTRALGTITVTADGILNVLLPSFTATVSTSVFATGTLSAAETIGKGSISYWSGPTTATTGGQTAVPGQPSAATAQVLSAPAIAFSSTGLVLSISTSWNPTIVVGIPAAAVAGTYTGTITHSVA